MITYADIASSECDADPSTAIPLIVPSIIKVALSPARQWPRSMDPIVRSRSDRVRYALTRRPVKSRSRKSDRRSIDVRSSAVCDSCLKKDGKVAEKKKRKELSSAFSNLLTSRERSCRALETPRKNFLMTAAAHALNFFLVLTLATGSIDERFPSDTFPADHHRFHIKGSSAGAILAIMSLLSESVAVGGIDTPPDFYVTLKWDCVTLTRFFQ